MLLTLTERKVEKHWPKSDFHVCHSLSFEPREAQRHNSSVLTSLSDEIGGDELMGALIVGHLLDCAPYGLFFGHSRFDGMMDVRKHFFFKAPDPLHPRAGPSFYD